MATQLDFAPAAERNKGPILTRLQPLLRAHRDVLEIGAGTGQHAVFFAAQMPWLRWLPTEREAQLPGLRARISAEGPPNCLAPLALDVDRLPWPLQEADVVYTANTLHIMAWDSVVALFTGLARLARGPELLCIYGPFKYAGDYTTPSNAAFDAALRAQDPASGLRDFEAVDRLATGLGLALLADHAMPANNQLLVWGRPGGG